MAASQTVAAIIRRHQIEKLGYLPCDKLKRIFARLEGRLPVRRLGRESA